MTEEQVTAALEGTPWTALPLVDKNALSPTSGRIVGWQAERLVLGLAKRVSASTLEHLLELIEQFDARLAEPPPAPPAPAPVQEKTPWVTSTPVGISEPTPPEPEADAPEETDALVALEADGWILVSDIGSGPNRILRVERSTPGGTQSAVGHTIAQVVAAALGQPFSPPLAVVSDKGTGPVGTNTPQEV